MNGLFVGLGGMFWLVTMFLVLFVFGIGWPITLFYILWRALHDLRRIANALEGAPLHREAAPRIPALPPSQVEPSPRDSIVRSAFGF